MFYVSIHTCSWLMFAHYFKIYRTFSNDDSCELLQSDIEPVQNCCLYNGTTFIQIELRLNDFLE